MSPVAAALSVPCCGALVVLLGEPSMEMNGTVPSVLKLLVLCLATRCATFIKPQALVVKTFK